MTAALCAAAQGLSSVVVEKDHYYGGTSAVSGGGIWIPCNHQIEALGGSDSPDEARSYLQHLTGGEVSPARLDAYIEHAREMVCHLQDRFGIRFESIPIYPDYFPDQPGGKPGYRTMEPAQFDASLLGDALAQQRPPYPGTLLLGRLAMGQVDAHTMLCRTPGWIGLFLKLVARYWLDFSWRRKTRRDRHMRLGQALVGSLRHALQRAGVAVQLDTGLQQLVSDDGRVVGVEVKRGESLLRLRARRGVVLACGGFEANQQMREQYLPAPTDKAWSAAPGINHGDGIRAGQSLGAATRFMDLTWGTPTVAVPDAPAATGLFVERACPRGLMVNGQGRRFVNEAGPYTEIIYAMYADHQKTGCSVPCWFICDAGYRKNYPLGPMMPANVQPDSRLPPDWLGKVYFKAATLDELAAQIGVDGHGLAASVAQYNAAAAAGVDTEFGKGNNVFDRYYGDPRVKPNPCLGPVSDAPYYALRIHPGELGTKGGLDADEAARVLRDDGSVISGLYAVGNTSAAVMGRTYAGPGATLGPAMTFAYLAVRDMAATKADGLASAA